MRGKYAYARHRILRQDGVYQSYIIRNDRFRSGYRKLGRGAYARIIQPSNMPETPEAESIVEELEETGNVQEPVPVQEVAVYGVAVKGKGSLRESAVFDKSFIVPQSVTPQEIVDYLDLKGIRQRFIAPDSGKPTLADRVQVKVAGRILDRIEAVTDWKSAIDRELNGIPFIKRKTDSEAGK